MRKNMKYKAVVFDFNGTLFFDSDKQERSWQVVAEKLRGEPLSGEELMTRIHGRSAESIFEYLLKRKPDDHEVAQLIAVKEDVYRELCLRDGARFRLSPGAVELLDFLVAGRIPHTIATASGIVNLEFFIRSFRLDRWFEVDKIVYDDGSLRGKPFPDMYRKAAARVGVEPEKCIVVEDAVSGIEAAYRAGIGRIVAVDSTFGADVLERQPGVAEVIGDLTQFDRSLLEFGSVG